jgi:hypothetical protein
MQNSDGHTCVCFLLTAACCRCVTIDIGSKFRCHVSILLLEGERACEPLHEVTFPSVIAPPHRSIST